MTSAAKRYAQTITAFKWILEIGYLIIVLSVLIQLIRVKCRTNRRSQKPIGLHILILTFAIVRAVLMVIPVSMYLDCIEKIPLLQLSLDMIPELLAFSVYLLLLLIWLEMYYFSTKDSRPNINRNLWIVFAAINVVVYILGAALVIVLSIVESSYNQNDLRAQAIFLSILSFGIAVTIPFFARLLFRTLSQSSVAISSNRKRLLLFRLEGLLITCVVCFLLHTVGIVVLDFIFRNLTKAQMVNAIVWFSYLLVTEQLPMFLILFFTGNLVLKGKRTPSKDSMIRDPLLERTQPYNIYVKKKTVTADNIGFSVNSLGPAFLGSEVESDTDTPNSGKYSVQKK